MKIPGGAVPPQPPQGPGTGGAGGAGAAGGAGKAQGAPFDAKIDQTQGSEQARGAAREASAPGGPQAAELRNTIQGLDRRSPEAMQRLSDKLVEWSLADQFGPGVLNAKGVEQLKAQVFQQLQDDPSAAARLQGILDQL